MNKILVHLVTLTSFNLCEWNPRLSWQSETSAVRRIESENIFQGIQFRGTKFAVSSDFYIEQADESIQMKTKKL